MPAVGDIQAALQLFDETTRVLEARTQRLEEVLTVKTSELQVANTALADKVDQLDALSARLELILGAVASGVIAVDGAGTVTDANPAARAALAASCPNPIGQDLAAVLPAHPALEAALAGGGASAVPFEVSVAGHDDRPRTLAGRVSPLQSGASGLSSGAVVVFEDVTQLRRLQDQLERGERLKALGEMAAGVAHEIRNPLNGIEGFASLLARDLDADAPGRRYADAVIDGVRHLNRTVTGLLAFTSPKPPERRALPLAELVASCIELVQAEAAEQDDAIAVAIDWQDHWGDARVACDGTQIRQVVLNLLQNAIAIQSEAVDTDVTARIAVRLAPGPEVGQVHLVVDDAGPGVPQHARHNIFTPFFTTRANGTGLGLAVAHTMVDLHGGSLVVDDAPDLGGARFVMVLPVSDS